MYTLIITLRYNYPNYDRKEIKTIIDNNLPVPRVGEIVFINDISYRVEEVYYNYDKDDEYVNIDIKEC